MRTVPCRRPGCGQGRDCVAGPVESSDSAVKRISRCGDLDDCDVAVATREAGGIWVLSRSRSYVFIARLVGSIVVSQDNSGSSVSRVDVLHISEAYGGGVQSAMLNYIENSPCLTHRMLVRARSEHDISENAQTDLVQIDGSMLTFLLQTRSYIRKHKPRAIHLHSSVAGLLRIFRFGDVKVFYTPHAYAFLRNDSGPLARSAYLTAEAALSRRPQTIAAISPYEAASAARLAGPSTAVVYLPNVVQTRSADQHRSPVVETKHEVVMVGRISAQKDPGFFAAVARAARSNVHWTWVGDGDAVMKSELEQAGVTVTGWLPNTQVQKHLARADLYLHSASWEGAPITLLEAAAVGTPILARGIAELEGLGFPLTENCPLSAAHDVDRFFNDMTFHESTRNATFESVEIHSPRVQKRALKSLYGSVG